MVNVSSGDGVLSGFNLRFRRPRWATRTRLRQNVKGTWTFRRHGNFDDYFSLHCKNVGAFFHAAIWAWGIGGIAGALLSEYIRFWGLLYVGLAIIFAFFIASLVAAGMIRKKLAKDNYHDLAEDNYHVFGQTREKHFKRVVYAWSTGLIFVPQLATVLLIGLEIKFGLYSLLSQGVLVVSQWFASVGNQAVRILLTILLFLVFVVIIFTVLRWTVLLPLLLSRKVLGPRLEDDEKLLTKIFLRITYKTNENDAVKATFENQSRAESKWWGDHFTKPTPINAITPSALANILPIVKHISNRSRRPIVLSPRKDTVTESGGSREFLVGYTFKPARSLSLIELRDFVVLWPLAILLLLFVNPWYSFQIGVGFECLQIVAVVGFLFASGFLIWWDLHKRTRLELNIDLTDRAIDYTIQTSKAKLSKFRLYFEDAQDFEVLYNGLHEISENEATRFNLDYVK